MISFLVRTFIKDHEKTGMPEVYLAYGRLAGITGIICNILLFAIKFSVGLISLSTSIIADAFNNLSDALSSGITLVSSRLAGRRTDAEHPFGYGRLEYIATFLIAILITNVGLEFFKTSLQKIREPAPLHLSPLIFVFLLITVAVKLWLYFFYRTVYKATGNKMINASSLDSLFDAVTCSITILSAFLFYYSGVNIDGYAGIIVSLIVIWSGIGIMKDAVNPLLGEPMDPVIAERISRIALSEEGVIAVHDLVIHSYGRGKHMATLHIEVPKKYSLSMAHALADQIESEVKRQLGILLVVHIDPVDTDDKRVIEIRESLTNIIHILDPELSFHDLQVCFEEDKQLICFDLVTPYSYDRAKEVLTGNQIRALMQQFYPGSEYRIKTDRGTLEENFTAVTHRLD